MSEPRPIPPRQAAVLATIKNWIDTKGFPPSLAEIADILKMAKPTAQSHVGKLLTRGEIRRVEGRIVLGSMPATGTRAVTLRDTAKPKSKRTSAGVAPTYPVTVRVTEDEVLVERQVNGKLVWAKIEIHGGKFRLDSNENL